MTDNSNMTNSCPSSPIDDWLEVATRGLCDASKARISQEIRTHCEVAAAEESEKGATPDDVDRKVIASLGDSRAAAKRFRKTHLTRTEHAVLKNYFDSALYYSLFVFLAFFSARGLWLTISHLQRTGRAIPNEFIFFASCFAIVGFCAIVLLGLYAVSNAFHRRKSPIQQALINLDLFTNFIFIMIAFGWLAEGFNPMYTSPYGHPPSMYFHASFLLTVCLFVVYRMRVVLKIYRRQPPIGGDVV
jgi:hypothetical protein